MFLLSPILPGCPLRLFPAPHLSIEQFLNLASRLHDASRIVPIVSLWSPHLRHSAGHPPYTSSEESFAYFTNKLPTSIQVLEQVIKREKLLLGQNHKDVEHKIKRQSGHQEAMLSE
jgi:hypothetical protein